ncbi:MAG TPA: PaaI family thioesterase [Paraburkholderia sp.]
MNLIFDNDGGLDGLEQLRALLLRGEQPPIGKTLDFQLTEVDRGRAVFEGRASVAVFNPIGSVHGGYAATLLDSACGCAVHSSLTAEQGYTTLELKVCYHRALGSESGLVRAEGKVISLGRRVAFAQAKLHDESGRLCASATSTLLVFDIDRAGR